MQDIIGLTRQQIAQLLASDIPDGSIVNLGIGMPTLVGDYLPSDKDILLHSENGILGMGPAATGDDVDLDLINASRQPNACANWTRLSRRGLPRLDSMRHKCSRLRRAFLAKRPTPP